MRSARRFFIWLPILLPSVSGWCADLNGFYRHPALHGDTLVFTSEGDLWHAPLEGGSGRRRQRASRLTTHAEQETHAAISPDGRQVAFSASYEGPTEVYVMPLEGGRPQRVTYDGERAEVQGWTPDGRIIYATRHFSTLPNTQLVLISPRGGEPTVLPLELACEAAVKPDGLTFFFARTTPQSGAVKRYRGGTAQQLWRFRLGDEEAVRLTDPEVYAGASREPLWWQSRIYFLTDRDGTMNIWSMSESGEDLTQHTRHDDFDVQSPSLDAGRIVYQQGADLWLFDIGSGASRRIDIELVSDFDQTREKWIDDPLDWLSSAHLSPTGDRVALTSRGRIFVAPVEGGRRTRLSRNAGERHRGGVFSADGKSVHLLSDASGEFEFWSYPASGAPEAVQLTRDADVLRYEGQTSPDGRRLVFADKNWRLWLCDLETRATRVIFESSVGRLGKVSWSPDSRWLAFSAEAENFNGRVWLHELASGTSRPVTSERVSSYSPAWDPEGEWLFFLSDRHLVSQVPSPWGLRQPEPYLASPTKIYMLALRTGLRSPFLARTELSSAAMDESDAKKEDTREEREAAKVSPPGEKAVELAIELEGIESRLYVLPEKPGRYSDLAAGRRRLFWSSYDPEERRRDLHALRLEQKEKPCRLVSDVRHFELSQDGKKLLVRRKASLHVLEAAKDSPKLDESRLDLSGWRFAIDTRAEWRQMFRDAWRMERDYFYDRGMHGLDWEGLRKRYEPLVERVRDREELNDVLHQLVGELEALHIRVRGGDHREDGQKDVDLASLGARLRRDEAGGGYRIDEIFDGDPDYPEELGPLARPEVAMVEGDLIREINHVPVLSVAHPQLLLRAQVGQQVLLAIQDSKTGKNREVVVEPVSMAREADLRYSHWELGRRRRVEERGAGKLGYLHLRAMSGRNYTEFVRNFYPVYRRQGLIIDVRHNRGGNIDSWILEKLIRKAWFFWQPRVGQPYWNMQYAFRGHLVVLCDEYTASDGEAFTEGFRRLGLGKVIGKRTWGGEIWLSANNRLVDGGIATAAEYGVYGPEREWLIEGHGVEPDIEVVNLPHATFRGQDAQLDRAIEQLLEKIEQEPVTVPEHPEYPNKKKR